MHEATVWGEKSVGGEDVEVRVEGFLEGIGDGSEEEVEEVAAFADDASQDLADGEDELAVRDLVTEGSGDPIGGLADVAVEESVPGGGVGRWMAKIVFISAFFVQGKTDRIWGGSGWV